ncbi:hypothetical protein HPB48_019525 [Haemaphysalis longicornis]|uniref:Uncharacterized protein n=1 Tax=Haemaphysalis longicornis TaxID=44386 RepID=A0A9J6FDB6_HAELO|nr:hypothetical protein HPB48_019525 [Haemaphysalis longicornis]
MELTRVAAKCQFKALARLQRLGSPIIDAVVEGKLRHAWAELGEQLGVPRDITDPVEVTSERPIRDGEDSAFHPDIVLSRAGNVFILDVAVTWDATPVSVDGACTAKEEKYRSLVPVFSPKPFEVLGLAFGVGGLLGPKARAAAKVIGNNGRGTGLVAARTVVSSIFCLN